MGTEMVASMIDELLEKSEESGLVYEHRRAYSIEILAAIEALLDDAFQDGINKRIGEHLDGVTGEVVRRYSPSRSVPNLSDEISAAYHRGIAVGERIVHISVESKSRGLKGPNLNTRKW